MADHGSIIWASDFNRRHGIRTPFPLPEPVPYWVKSTVHRTGDGAGTPETAWARLWSYEVPVARELRRVFDTVCRVAACRLGAWKAVDGGDPSGREIDAAVCQFHPDRTPTRPISWGGIGAARRRKKTKARALGLTASAKGELIADDKCSEQPGFARCDCNQSGISALSSGH